MTSDVEELKNNMINNVSKDVNKLKSTICNRELTNAQLSKRVVELKYTGQIEEAKKLVDDNLKIDVFNIIFTNGGTVEQTKEKFQKVIAWYEKYYKCLNCEIPNEIKDIDIKNVLGDYATLKN